MKIWRIILVMKIDCCERECPRRKVGCHANCKEYIEQKAKIEDERKKKWLAKEYDAYMSCKHKGKVI
jgi:hypothetical protein